MATEVRLPQLGQTMEEGTIVGYMVGLGDEVKKGDCIFEVETDKATLEVESPTDGFVKHILAEEGQTLLVGEPILILGDKAEDVPQSFIDSLRAAPVGPAAQPLAAEPVGKPIATPRAKKLARDLGVNLAAVTGTGPAGKITEQDVSRAAEAGPDVSAQAPAEAGLGATIPVNKLQRLTAERVLRSKREIPCFYLTVRADVTDLVELRNELNEAEDVKISYSDFIIRAVAVGLERFAIMTGQLEADSIKMADTINVGLAVSAPNGLIVPVIKNANKKDIKQISAETSVLIEKAQSQKLLLTDLEGACITVSNLGGFGIESFTPIVIPGQCSILGVGRITDICVPDDGGIGVRKLMAMTLAVDHRVTNGAYAARFLDFVKGLLEDASNFA